MSRVRHQGQVSGPLYSLGQGPLVFGAVPCDATRDDLASLRREEPQGPDVLVVDGEGLVSAKPAYLSSMETPSSLRWWRHWAKTSGKALELGKPLRSPAKELSGSMGPIQSPDREPESRHREGCLPSGPMTSSLCREPRVIGLLGTRGRTLRDGCGLGLAYGLRDLLLPVMSRSDLALC